LVEFYIISGASGIAEGCYSSRLFLRIPHMVPDY
jgi:hypothetical protein